MKAMSSTQVARCGRSLIHFPDCPYCFPHGLCMQAPGLPETARLFSPGSKGIPLRWMRPAYSRTRRTGWRLPT
jgi:hypothetical protein